ncbi:surface carbohydrate biosynthesis protein [Ectopseudomonas alcaliphila]|uniref:surface carbohydrate biosynthesis protein n=1 Tax=Ectopseudomonas alcaliphila TaxID=101564 RepID=UPI002780993D|nr:MULTISPECIES: surface carbohydrate biosynthesis protein [Pseudomonas]MDP9940103.1 surface carbohydrate biosynthesis protein [Pseudomonas sp. 3400]MDR7012330.1 surface carbohydrate biosynthesis protein [Pseudomonas alcaliphila]
MLMEVKARELEGRSLLAFHAALSGHQVFIGRTRHILDGIKYGVIPAGVLFEKSISAAKFERLSARLGSGNLLVCQDEESGLLSESYDQFLDIRSSVETMRLTDAVFCWGEHDAFAWRSRYPESSEKIHSTGSPRVDFWRPEFLPYFSSQVSELKKRYGSYVLIASNFASANGVVAPEEMVENAWKYGRIKTSQDEKLLRDYISDDIRMFRAFVDMLRDLAARSLGVQFVIRPHPAELIEPWQEAFAGCKNVHVVFEGGISSWVRGSLAILHNGCTTALESYVTGVPSIAYVPFESQRNREIPNRLSICRSTADEVAEDIKALVAGIPISAKSPENDSLVSKRLANSMGELAVARIVKALSHLPDAPHFVPKYWRARLLGLRFMVRKFVRQKMLRRVTKVDRKFSGLSLKELVAIRDRLALYNPAYRRCGIRHVYGDVFIIKMNDLSS